MTETLSMGAVAYAPKVVTIWEGFKAYFRQTGLAFDFVLYSNYEKQIEALFNDEIQVAWNSPLAWIRAERVARTRGGSVSAVAMRDTDCDLTSLIVVRADAPIHRMPDLRGKRVGVGAIDSPQATLIPLDHLVHVGGLAFGEFHCRRFDILAGKHGDHVGGERDSVLALLRGEVDAACLLAGNLQQFIGDGTVPPDSVRVLAETAAFDHCNFTVTSSAPVESVNGFVARLLGMSWNDPEVRPLLQLEGLTRWLPGRATGYAMLARAVDEQGFYSSDGAITASGYCY